MSVKNVSVFIQTLNEENNIEHCLKCFDWCDDIVILDSCSTDKTKEIAEKFGVRWYERKFEGRAEHQNWAMKNIKFKYDWVFYADADERFSEALINEIILKSSLCDNGICAYMLRRRDMFMQKWIKYSSQYPVWIIRLFKPDKIRWERKANPIAIVDGDIGCLTNDYIHYSFSKGISEWFVKQNRTTTFEAEEAIKVKKEKKIDYY